MSSDVYDLAAAAQQIVVSTSDGPAEWLSAIATSLAVIVSLVVVLRDRQRFLDAEEERQKEQASRVWVGQVDGWSGAEGPGWVTRNYPIRYGNNSDDIIDPAVLYLRVEPASAIVVTSVQPQPPGTKAEQWVYVGRLLPKSTGSQTFTVSLAKMGGSHDPASHEIKTRLHFTDSASRHWIRDENGQLRRTLEAPPRSSS